MLRCVTQADSHSKNPPLPTSFPFVSRALKMSPLLPSSPVLTLLSLRWSCYGMPSTSLLEGGKETRQAETGICEDSAFVRDSHKGQEDPSTCVGVRGGQGWSCCAKRGAGAGHSDAEEPKSPFSKRKLFLQMRLGEVGNGGGVERRMLTQQGRENQPFKKWFI